MNQMKSDTLRRIGSLALGLLGLAGLVYIDIEIATAYREADGKTQALFGTMVFLRFSHKYLVLIPAVLAILLTSKFFWTGKFKLVDIASLIFGVASIIGTITSSWRLLI
jgi:hypothetical protein